MKSAFPAIHATAALVAGSAIGYLDSRPNWDDTGVTVGAVLISAAIIGSLRPRLGVALGALVGVPVLAFEYLTSGGIVAMVVIAIGMVGGGLGVVLRGAASPGERR